MQMVQARTQIPRFSRDDKFIIVELGSFGFGMNKPLHLSRPLQEPPQIPALPPHKFPELDEADLRHLHATVSLHSPQKIRTPPGSEAMAFGRIPEKTQRLAHGDDDT
jgi:hypothetical protein